MVIYQYIDVSKRKHGLDDANEALDIEVIAASLTEADQEYFRMKGVHPAKNPNVVVRRKP